MSFAVIWDYAALATWYELPKTSAEVIATSVVRFAELGVGHLEWVPPYHRLRAGAHDVALVIQRDKRTLVVIRIYRRR